MRILNQKIEIDNADIELYIKREDLIHPLISGNKYRKLKYNIQEAINRGVDTVVTFGGAFSNHILAVAAAANENKLNSIGIIRGEELESKIGQNPTLSKSQDLGMKFDFISREEYRDKSQLDFSVKLKDKYGDFYLIPEGGTNDLAIKGCEEILEENDNVFDFVCCAVGTGGTISGLINSIDKKHKVLGFPALKGEFLQNDIRKFVKNNNWELISDYHFGGYGKITKELIEFINSFKKKYDIPLDPVYTGKMVFGVMDLIENNYFPKNSKILMIHTGGIQGIEGMNNKLKNKNLIIDV